MIRLQHNIFPAPKRPSSYVPPVNRELPLVSVGPVNPAPSMKRIKQAASKVFDVPVDIIEGRGRVRKTMLARFAVCAVARAFGGKSYTHIGRHLGHRDHTSIMHAIATVPKYMAHFEGYSEKVEAVIRIAREEA